MRETWVQSLSWDEPLQEGLATHSTVLVWRIPTYRGACRATVDGVAESDMTEASQHSTAMLLWRQDDLLNFGPFYYEHLTLHAIWSIHPKSIYKVLVDTVVVPV